MTVVGSAFRRASDQLGRTVASVDEPSLENLTPCDISIRALIEHVLAGNEFAVRLLAGATADEARAGIDEIRLGADPVEQVAGSCVAQTEAFAAGDRNRPLHHPSGDIDYDTFVRFRLGELVVHAWDIAVAAALDPALEPETVEDLWRRVRPHLSQMRAMGAHGAGSTGRLPPGAPVQDRLLDAFGRQHDGRHPAEG